MTGGQPVARVSSLRIHPLKSGAITRVASSPVDRAGLRHDRRWMVVDLDGECVTARTDRALFTLTATPLPDDGLRLACRDGDHVEVGRPTAPAELVTVHGHLVAPGRPMARPAQELVRHVLRRDDVTIVWCADPAARRLDPAYARAGDSTAYADGYPVTLASLASLRELARLGGDVPIDRFRPNVVIDGDLAAFAEETWTRVRIGAVPFRVVRGVDRCAMTLIDPVTLATGPEPLRTLARHRRWEGRTWFCRHLIPEDTGTITVGDDVWVA